MVKKSIDNNTQQTRTLLAIRANKNAYSQILVLLRFHLEGHFEICLESKQLFPVLLYFQQHSGTGFSWFSFYLLRYSLSEVCQRIKN